MGQFDFQTSSSPLLTALAQAPQQKQQAEIQLEEARRQRLNSLLGNMQQFATLARNVQQIKQASLEQEQTQQQMSARNNLADLFGRQNEPVAGPQNIQAGPQMPGQDQPLLAPRQTFGQTPSYQQQVSKSIIQGFPEQAASVISKQQFPDEDALMMKKLREENYRSLINKRETPVLQSKNISYDGKPAVADFDPTTGTYYRSGTKEILNGKEISSGNILSPVAEVRRNTLIANLGDRMSKKMNPANWAQNTVAGKSAALVANADSGINLADQMLSGQIPTTAQTMTSLALDTNRVLTQTGVTSEKTTAELKAKTGFASLASGLQYFTAHPTDQRLQPFVQILKTEMKRQRDQRQSIVDRTLSSELSSMNELKRLSPKDWEDQVIANGFDLEAAKKGKLKIRPEIGSTMYGWDIGDSSKGFGQTAGASGGISIDQNSLDAELRRRGLQ